MKERPIVHSIHRGGCDSFELRDSRRACVRAEIVSFCFPILLIARGDRPRCRCVHTTRERSFDIIDVEGYPSCRSDACILLLSFYYILFNYKLAKYNIAQETPPRTLMTLVTSLIVRAIIRSVLDTYTVAPVTKYIFAPAL